jgi:hypothetical protein
LSIVSLLYRIGGMTLRLFLLLVLHVAALAGDPFTTGEFKWKSSHPLVAPAVRPDDPCDSIKDPTVVFHEGKWHLFCTIRSQKRTHQIEYLNFTDWKDADQAPRHILKLHDGYFCAPQVFYFTPLKKWCLLYQTGDPGRTPPLQPTLVMSDKLDDPAAWSKPQILWDRSWPDCPRAIDFWIICDATHARLFFTSNDGKFWRSDAPLAQFPKGFADPKMVMQGDLFEASCTYKIKGGEYLTLIEAQGGGGRYFKAWTAPRLDAEWKPLATTMDKSFASRHNVTFPGVGPDGSSTPPNPWAQSISHGELLRSGIDEKMEIDPANLKLLYQGVTDADMAGKPYGKIPWRLGLLELEK